jgi:hypothetical protein
MPTRTINLKMVLGKKQDTEELRQALWTTHREINLAVAKLEKTFLLCRGAEYRTTSPGGEELLVTGASVVQEALYMAREAQKRNGKEGVGSDQEVLKLLRRLYEQIVPSCCLDNKGKPLDGDAKAANAWVSPLMDPKSEGLLSNFDIVFDPLPPWIEMMNTDEDGWENESHLWLQSEEAKTLRSIVGVVFSSNARLWVKAKKEKNLKKKPGRTPSWVKNLLANGSWQKAFIKDQEKTIKKLKKGYTPLVRSMKRFGLLPLIDPSLRERLDPNGTGVKPWDRLAIQLAVGHLLSWESWNHNTKNEHDKAKAEYNGLFERYESYEEQLKELREYEQERQKELEQFGLARDDRPFKIGARSIRSWGQVREEWLNTTNYKDRKEVLKRLQTNLRGKFGDPHLFLWIAADGREHLWKTVDTLTPLVKINIAQQILEKRKPYSLMTFADARLHPRWVLFEAPGGTNLRNYEIKNHNSKLSVLLLLLKEADNGRLIEKKFSIRLSPTAQLSDLNLLKHKKKTCLRYRSAHQVFEGVPGGAEILFHRLYIEHHERLEAPIVGGSIGPAWFKLTLDVTTQAPEEWIDVKGRAVTPLEVYHFRTALSPKKTKYADKLQPGLRVMSVDLGLRTFASCSVFELQIGKPNNRLFFPVADGLQNDDPGKLWAKHERSFKLCLPGETPSTKEKTARKTVMKELRAIRTDISRLRNILRLGILEDNDQRDMQLKNINDSISEDISEGSVLTPDILVGLDDPKTKLTFDAWQLHCQEIYDQAEKIVSDRFSEWRRLTSPKSISWADWRQRRSYHGGKSIWMLEYLESVRKLIMSWNLRGRKYGQINRQNKKQFGTIASRLLHHINQLKEDRVKTGADLIIQACRGYVRRTDGIGWKKKHEPCRAILFEDLARYRFRVDRPRRENSQLMKWNHREIVNETNMQAELYGIIVETTAAGFSSRYLASTGTPGYRCRFLSEDDFQNGLPKVYVVSELEWMLGNSKRMDLNVKQTLIGKKIKPGLLVPWSGGELFASVGRNAGPAHIVHADINAAQNLQRRFWGRCGEAFRLPCKAVNGTEFYEPAQKLGPRMLGALIQMENGKHPFYLKDELGNQHYIMKRSNDLTMVVVDEKPSESENEYEDAVAELADENASSRETFFRDPSGIFFNPGHWIPSKLYWSIIRKKVWAAMENSG